MTFLPTHARRLLAGLTDAGRAGHPLARLSMARDQAVVTRHLFLAGAVRLEALPELRRPRTPQELAPLLGVAPSARLDGWLALGVACGELQERGGRFGLRGRRARALAAGDHLITSWYRILLDFGTAIPAELPELLAGTRDRPDLAAASDTIAALAEMSDAAMRPLVGEALTGARTLLDVGCGDGRLLDWVLQRAPRVQVTGVDQEPAVIALAAARLPGTAQLQTARLEDLPPGPTYDVVVSANAVYYRPPAQLGDHVRQLAARVAAGGQLVVGTAVQPLPGTSAGRVLAPVVSATALLDLQLRCQPGDLRLPTSAELEAAVAATGLQLQASHRALPGLPFLTLRARRP